jgi:DNA-binding transcriptional regulator YhcF (GntR family)
MLNWKREPHPRSTKWAHISDDIQAAIATGQLCPGDRVPTEGELVAEYTYSRSTVRSATGDLKRLGLIVVDRPHGTFVSRQAPERLRAPKAAEVRNPDAAYTPIDESAVVAHPNSADVDVDVHPGASLVARMPTKDEIAKYHLRKRGEPLVEIFNPDGQVERHGSFKKRFRYPLPPPTGT